VRFGDADPQEHCGNAGDRLRRSRPADDRRRDVRGHDPDPLLRDAQQLDHVRGCGPGDRNDPGGCADESEIALIGEASVRPDPGHHRRLSERDEVVDGDDRPLGRERRPRIRRIRVVPSVRTAPAQGDPVGDGRHDRIEVLGTDRRAARSPDGGVDRGGLPLQEEEAELRPRPIGLGGACSVQNATDVSADPPDGVACREWCGIDPHARAVRAGHRPRRRPRAGRSSLADRGRRDRALDERARGRRGHRQSSCRKRASVGPTVYARQVASSLDGSACCPPRAASGLRPVLSVRWPIACPTAPQSRSRSARSRDGRPSGGPSRRPRPPPRRSAARSS
jgi:hypothetical protein